MVSKLNVDGCMIRVTFARSRNGWAFQTLPGFRFDFGAFLVPLGRVSQHPWSAVTELGQDHRCLRREEVAADKPRRRVALHPPSPLGQGYGHGLRRGFALP